MRWCLGLTATAGHAHARDERCDSCLLLGPTCTGECSRPLEYEDCCDCRCPPSHAHTQTQTQTPPADPATPGSRRGKEEPDTNKPPSYCSCVHLALALGSQVSGWPSCTKTSATPRALDLTHNRNLNIALAWIPPWMR